MSAAGHGLSAFRNEVSDAIADMLYISESESGLELLPCDSSLTSQDALRAALPEGAGSASAAEFLEKLRRSIDTTDEALLAYLGQWEHLFQLLEDNSDDIRVYRSGSDPVEILIAAIVDGGMVVVRTSAVET